MSEISLGGYPAKTCARAVHNDFTPGLDRPEAPPERQRFFDEGILFETEITDWMRHAYARAGKQIFVGTERSRRDWDANIAATHEAMQDRVEVIVNGRLRDINGRSGAPDVLLLATDGYLPVDIKGHQTLTAMSSALKPTSKVEVSTLLEPLKRQVHVGQSGKTGHWKDDAIQLAHYTRMLQDYGMHAGDDYLLGGIIGTSEFEAIIGDRYGVTWYDLARADWLTYSATGSNNRKKRSPLERYDHEFAFRAKVAAASRRGEEIVFPYRIKECDSCVWFDHCVEVAGPEDASFAITSGQLTVRQWQYLYPEGRRLTIDELAELDVASLTDGFTQQSAGTPTPEARLANAVRRACMHRAGIHVEPLDGQVWTTPPMADVEIDFDIEWDSEGRIYQWGLRVRDDQDESTARYLPGLVSFEELDEESELDLAEAFADALEQVITQAEAAGRSWTIFHWSDPEVTRTSRFPRIADLLAAGPRQDLLHWFQRHYFGRDGASLKPVATALGFAWSVEDPGGLYSMEQIEMARGTGSEADAAQQWCLSYNESDVAAQAAVRDALGAAAIAHA